MPLAPNARLLLVGLLLAILFAGYSGLHEESQRLLTPIPSDAIGIPIVLSLLLALGMGALAASAITNRLLRRLLLLGTMAATLYLCGESYRGLHARTAFTGPVTTSTERWMVLGGGQGSTITAQSLARRKSFAFPATAEAVTAVGFGRCVDVRIERSAGGVERIAPDDKPLSPADLVRC